MSSFRLVSVQSRHFLPTIIICVTILFSVMSILAYTQLYKQRQALEKEMGRKLSEQISNAMSIWLDDQVRLAKSMALLPEVKDFCQNPDNPVSRERLERYLEEIHQKNLPDLTLFAVLYFSPVSDNFFIVRRDGKAISTPYGGSILDSIGGRSIGVGDLSFTYIKAIADGAKAFISEAKPNAIAGLPPVFMVTVPVYDDAGNLIAAFGFGEKLEHFSERFITNFNFGQAGRIDILDNRGFYIGHSQQEKILTDRVLKETKHLLPFLNANNPTSFSLKFDGSQHFYSATPVHSPHRMANAWWVLFHRAADEIHQELRPQLYALIAACLLGISLSIGLGISIRSTAQGEMACELRNQDAKRKALYVDNTPYGIFLLSRDGIILDANSAASNMFGYLEEEVPDRSIFDFIPDCPVHAAQAFDSFDDIDGSLPGKHRNSGELHIRASLRHLDDKLLLFIRDVTALMHQQRVAETLSENLQNTLKESENSRLKAEKNNQAKSEFLANISHEVHTLMNTVLGMSHLLLETELTDQQRDYVSKVTIATHSLLDIINVVLDFSKIETGRMKFASIPLDIAQVFENLHMLFAKACHDKGLSLTLEVDSAIPGNLSGDPKRLGQILSSLVENAVKFTQQGSVAVSCALQEIAFDHAMLRFTVADTGIGVSQENLDSLFDPFA